MQSFRTPMSGLESAKCGRERNIVQFELIYVNFESLERFC